MSVQELAQAAEELHVDLLQSFSSGTLDRMAAIDAAIGIRRDFTMRVLPQLGVSYPHQLTPTTPEHAIAKAVIDDLIDTENRIQSLATNAKLQKQAVKIMQTTNSEVIAAAGADMLRNIGKGAREILPDIGKAGIWIAVGAAGLIVLYMLLKK